MEFNNPPLFTREIVIERLSNVINRRCRHTPRDLFHPLVGCLRRKGFVERSSDLCSVLQTGGESREVWVYDPIRTSAALARGSWPNS
jgi:hypothetical protein